MLNALEGVSRCAVALIYFCGLRPGEARGVRWEDYDDNRLFVRHSVWRTHVTEPKTAESATPVPVCGTLAEILEADRKESGYILSRPRGKPANLNNLAKRVVLPALRKAKIQWHGGTRYGEVSRRLQRRAILPLPRRYCFGTATLRQPNSITSKMCLKRRCVPSKR
jgi:integrase